MTDQIILLGVKGGPSIRKGGAVPTSSVLQVGGLGDIRRWMGSRPGVDFVANEVGRARARGQDLHLTAAHPEVLGVLRRTHCTDVVGEDNIHPHKSDAISVVVGAADNEICRNAACAFLPNAPASPEAKNTDAA